MPQDKEYTRFIDEFSMPDDDVGQMCDYCDSPADISEPDPYDSEILLDDTPKHHACLSPACRQLMQLAMDESASNI